VSRTFQRDLLITLIANLLSKPAWLLADNLIQNQIGHEAYGLIGALLGLGQWATAIADWGLYALVTREMARLPDQYSTLSATTLTLKLGLSLTAFVLFTGLGWLIGYQQAPAFVWLLLLLLYQISLSYLQFFRAYFQGTQSFRIDAFFSALEKGILLLFLVLFWEGLTADRYVGLLVLSGVLSASTAGVWVRLRYGPVSWQPRLTLLWEAFRQMTPFALMGYVSAINERINQILLERWIGAYENGLYWGAYRWLSAAMMYLWIVMPLFFARFAHLGREKSPELWRTFVWGHLVAALPLIGIAGVFLAEPRLFLFLFSRSTPEELATMSATLQTMALPLTLNGLFIIYSTYLTAVGYEWIALRLMLLAVTANILTCAFLLPLWAEVGAAIALGISYAVYGVGYVWAFHKVAPIPVPLSVLFRLAALALIYEGGMLAFSYLPVPTSVRLVLAPVFLALCAWITQIYPLWRYAHRHR
jgi:O-antigen/teichoic acid export membrane protein